MEFLEKVETVNEDLLWNVPEKAQGTVNIIGGNLQNFRTPVKIAEFLGGKYPIKTVNLILPDVLKNNLPALENLVFLESTDSGSLADEVGLLAEVNKADYNLMIGDLSRNSITGKALARVAKDLMKPTLFTRDAVDLLAENLNESVLLNENLIIMASMIQLQKVFRAVYYPKMLTLSMPLPGLAETLHKFTLSYPIALITLHNGQNLVAKNGKVEAIDLGKTEFSPISFWGGEAAAKIIALNLFNPNNFLAATTSAIISAQF